MPDTTTAASTAIDHANYLSEYDKSLMLKLLEENKLTYTAIAERFNTTLSNVSHFAADHAVRPKDILKLAGPRAARNWVGASDAGVEKGLHAASKDLLLHIGAIEPLAESTKGQVVVTIGMQIQLTPPETASNTCAIAVTATEPTT